MNQMADMILYNGKFYKSDPHKQYAEAVAIQADRFICVGTLEECMEFQGKHTKLRDMMGRFILPGLIDGHTHPEIVAKSCWHIQMPEFDRMEDLLFYVKQYCEDHPIEELPYFFGEFYPTTWFDDHGPRKEWIDEYVSDRPVRLQDFSDHACWYNSKALELMGIDQEREETGTAPYYTRNENNEPTGWVQEPLIGKDEEIMFERIGWHPPTECTEETIMPFLNFLNDYGVIGLLDGITEGEEAMKLFYDLDQAGRLNLYYEGACLLEGFDQLDQCVKTAKAWQKKYASKHVGLHTVKFFLDRTNEIGNSASLVPFSNDPTGTNFGQINMTEEELVQTLLRLNEEGLDFHVHVVCDRGFRTACDAYEKAKNVVAESGKAWRIYMELAHCELVHPDDRKRPAELGIIINWTCHWAGGFFGESAKDFLGKERFESMYDFTEMIESGAIMTYSSDVAGVSEEQRSNPYFGMEISATRVDLEMPLDPSRYPGSVRPPKSAMLSVEEMIRGYTRYGAIPLRLEDKLGTIEAGKQANLVVLDQNILEMPVGEIHQIKPTAVMFDGRLIRGQL
ncbi:MAG: amidohydrolase family protein [Firmicutes bacterium]|jgi:predicted amidohydrolase YtcJ|nr:amidohydrolase family protein [Bacillota bacterium]NBI62521.1 hypothetical protein [Clostridiales bacterium]